MNRFLLAIIIGLCASYQVAANVLTEAVEEISESYEKCEQLLEQVRTSECANSLFGILGRMYFEIGVSFTERQVKFQHIETEKDAFILSSGFKPRPIFSVSLSDSYFENSNFGYGLGFSYFDDYAFEQVVKRGSSENDKKTVDLGTYSSMNVIAITPSIFYGFGRQDATPNRFGKIGLGLNLMYSAVRGTAYLTEETSNVACFDYGSQYVEGLVTDVTQFDDLCEEIRFRESSFGTGFKLFLDGEWNKWKGELSTSIYLHRGDGEYRFVTQQAQFAFSRKFEF